MSGIGQIGGKGGYGLSGSQRSQAYAELLRLAGPHVARRFSRMVDTDGTIIRDGRREIAANEIVGVQYDPCPKSEVRPLVLILKNNSLIFVSCGLRYLTYDNPMESTQFEQGVTLVYDEEGKLSDAGTPPPRRLAKTGAIRTREGNRSICAAYPAQTQHLYHQG